MIGVWIVRLSILLTAVLGALLPLQAGVVFTVDPTNTFPTIAGTYAGGVTLLISISGTVNLNGPNGQIVTNPDGSLVTVPAASCTVCWSGYQYFIGGSNAYPTVAGGDGINHFVGGGGNFDHTPGNNSPWAAVGKHTTDTTDPGAIRFGALAYTFHTNPTPTDWLTLGGGGTFVTPAGGGTLLMVVADTFYPNNTGGYTVTVNQLATDTPEPSAMWLAFSGFAVLGLPRAYRKLSRK
jgi:hypothetical protein